MSQICKVIGGILLLFIGIIIIGIAICFNIQSFYVLLESLIPYSTEIHLDFPINIAFVFVTIGIDILVFRIVQDIIRITKLIKR